LIDQDGQFALFDILMNRPMFDFILKHDLYSKAGQQKVNETDKTKFPQGRLEFPIGSNPSGAAPGRMGAIMLKVSYRILDPQKDKNLLGQFHTSDALIYFPGPPATKTGPACVEKKLGLVGFHVGHKTNFAPQWVWTSFEHVSNVPDADDVASGPLLPRYNFFNAACKNDCPVVNDTPPQPWDPDVTLKFNGNYRSQVVRQKMIPSPVLKEVAELNNSFRGILKTPCGKTTCCWRRSGRATPRARPTRSAPPRRPISPTARWKPTARDGYRWRRRAAWPATATPPPITFPPPLRISPSSWKRPSNASEVILTDLTRRNILTGAAVTAAGAVASTNLATPAEAATPSPVAPSTANATPAVPNTAPTPFPEPDPDDLKLFVALSSALTGISAAKLAPAVDPIQIKRDYFNAAKFIEKPSRKLNPNFPKLMDIIRADPTNPVAAAAKVMNNPDPAIMYLGRSIVLAWYLGAWYDPDVLKRYNTPNQPFPVPVDRVISPAAYTQGWTWRVAQAHPMGYSEMRFGYWAQDALPLSDYIA
jgi:hypothetical protein